MSTSWLCRSVRSRISRMRELERAAGRRWSAGLERVLASGGAGEVLLDVQQVVPPALDDREELGHRGDLLALLLEEPVQELLADQLALFARELHERDDLIRHPLLLRERERDRRDRVGKARLRRLDTGDDDLRVRIEQVLHDHHRVVSLLERLPVE